MRWYICSSDTSPKYLQKFQCLTLIDELDIPLPMNQVGRDHKWSSQTVGGTTIATQWDHYRKMFPDFKYLIKLLPLQNGSLRDNHFTQLPYVVWKSSLTESQNLSASLWLTSPSSKTLADISVIQDFGWHLHQQSFHLWYYQRPDFCHTFDFPS